MAEPERGQRTEDGQGTGPQRRPGPRQRADLPQQAGLREQTGLWQRAGLGRWWRRRGLRSRVTLTAAAGLLVAFAAADLLLLGAVRVALNNSVDDSARQAADQVVAMINSQTLPDPVPVSAGTVSIQVLDTSGQITDVSPDADRRLPLLTPRQAAQSARTGRVVQMQGPPYGLSTPLLRVVAVSAANGDLVIVAVPYNSATATLSALGRALLIGTPLLFLLFTGAIWLAVGSTLRPIALLRKGAAEVSATGVPQALPVPEARDEVRSLALTLNGMLSRLALARKRQRDLVSDTAHELRSPIASIRTQLEVALDHPAGQDWAATASDVHADTLRLSRLAEDLLVLARLDERADARSGNGTGSPGAVTVADLAAVSADVARRYAQARVPVRVEAAGPCLVAADPAGLDRVLVNLIDNAVRYAASQVTVTARAVTGESGGATHGPAGVAGAESMDGSPGGGWAGLAVTDDGPGIAEADLERAFGRFTRLDDARTRDDPADEASHGGGAGLGLAIVRATAQACGGTARLERVEPTGLRAVVRLPLAATPLAPGSPATGVSATGALGAGSLTTGATQEDAREQAARGVRGKLRFWYLPLVPRNRLCDIYVNNPLGGDGDDD